MSKHKIGIIGLGKITQDQHIPVIQGNPAFELLAVSSQRGLKVPGVPYAYTQYADLLANPEITAVAVCTPPNVRHTIAREALLAGKDVLLEKPPAATLSELVDLKETADRVGKVLFTTWHSQYNAAVDEAKRFLSTRTVKTLLVSWKEDVRHWHPGQAWIWQAGGFGVFDPGINALSIVTKIMPNPLFVTKATLEVPENCAAPIGATVSFGCGVAHGSLEAVFDWRQTGPQSWNIEVTTDDGADVKLSFGGSRLDINGELKVEEKMAEYEGIYRRFDDLLTTRTTDVDERPFRLVADAFMIGQHTKTDAFIE